mmetsp:Transcript_21041/g.58511  ORF Transcript_21041/g.58511 Transcript_21041/m.58511 type:complete len:290 (-) Transcript_21041:1803-2672(-)
MRRGWKIPALYLATTGQLAFGFVSHRLSTIATASSPASASSLSHLTGLDRTFDKSRDSSNTKTTFRNMSSEVVAGEDHGPKDQTWRSLLEVSMARSRRIRGSNYVQISTVNKDGEPRCRTVVFRGFLNNKNLSDDHPMSVLNGGQFDGKPCVMKMCTDLRSKKVDEVAHQPISEMVWWFPKTSEQYRVRGSLLLVGDESDDRNLQIARKEMWGNISDPARESFLDDKSPVPVGGRDEEGKVVPVPTNFLLMLLDPIHVDYLRLTGAQYRQIDERQPRDGASWSSKSVKP